MNKENRIEHEECSPILDAITEHLQELEHLLDSKELLDELERFPEFQTLLESPPILTIKRGDFVSTKEDLRVLDDYLEYWGAEDVPLIDEPQDFIPDILNTNLRRACKAVLDDEHLSFDIKEKEVPKRIADLLVILDVVYWEVRSQGTMIYLDERISEGFLSNLRHDALLKAVYDSECSRLSNCLFAKDSSVKGSDWYSFTRLLNLRNSLFPKQKTDKEIAETRSRENRSSFDDMRKHREFNVENADCFAQQFGDDPLFSFFAFALLAETNLTRTFSGTNRFKEFEKSVDLNYVLQRMKSRWFMGENGKERDFQRSMKYLYLFSECMDGNSFLPKGDPLVVPDITEPQKHRIPLRTTWEYKEYLSYEIYERVHNQLSGYASKEYSPMPHAALNLYCFNDTTGLLDWVYAVKNQSSACIHLEHMLFSKNSKIPWVALGEQERTLLLDACNRVFHLFYQEYSVLSEDELATLYYDEEDNLDECAKAMLQDMRKFHYLYGQAASDENLEGTREQPQKRVYDTVREYTKKRNDDAE